VYTSLGFGNFPRVCRTVPRLSECDDGNHLRELRNSVSHSAFLESLNSETVHIRTYVGIKYFDCLHVRNSFLNLCHVFLEHPV
jgi:hypothetical protein